MIAKAPDCFAYDPQYPLVSTGKDHMSIALRRRDRHELRGDITCSAPAVRLGEAASGLSLPQFVYRRRGFSGDKKHVAEMRFIVRPAPVARLPLQGSQAGTMIRGIADCAFDGG